MSSSDEHRLHRTEAGRGHQNEHARGAPPSGSSGGNPGGASKGGGNQNAGRPSGQRCTGCGPRTTAQRHAAAERDAVPLERSRDASGANLSPRKRLRDRARHSASRSSRTQAIGLLGRTRLSLPHHRRPVGARRDRGGSSRHGATWRRSRATRSRWIGKHRRPADTGPSRRLGAIYRRQARAHRGTRDRDRQGRQGRGDRLRHRRDASRARRS